MKRRRQEERRKAKKINIGWRRRIEKDVRRKGERV
jgi:hypothetical protein